jgi:phospholipid/cholesterol/gamma-HCH transport system permease protein
MGFLMPILIVYAGFSALLGSFYVCYFFLEQSFETFSDSIVSYFQLQDIFFGLAKGFIFGLETAIISVWLGLQTEGGAAGLGQKTIRSFVTIAITILITDSLFWIIL